VNLIIVFFYMMLSGFSSSHCGHLLHIEVGRKGLT
jgi:hypothetical protein